MSRILAGIPHIWGVQERAAVGQPQAGGWETGKAGPYIILQYTEVKNTCQCESARRGLPRLFLAFATDLWYFYTRRL